MAAQVAKVCYPDTHLMDFPGLSCCDLEIREGEEPLIQLQGDEFMDYPRMSRNMPKRFEDCASGNGAAFIHALSRSCGNKNLIEDLH
jgi:hypothetical protein